MGSSNRKTANINDIIAVDTYVTGVSISKTSELSAEVVLISPAKNTIVVTWKKLKGIIFDLSEEHLKLNIKKHVAKVRYMPDYKGDITFTIKNKLYSICRGTLDMDGAGNTHAYSHRIVHHHCGNHKYCNKAYCKYASIALDLLLKNKVMNKD